MFVLFVWVGMNLLKDSHRGVADPLCQGTGWQVAREKEGDATYQASPITVQLPNDLSLSQVTSPKTKEDLGEASLVLGVGRAPPPIFPLASCLHLVVWTHCCLIYSKNLSPALLLKEDRAQWYLTI